MLRIAGYRDAELDGWSDAICTALQLTNFWQDLKVDCDRGRVYLPAEELRAHGAPTTISRLDDVTPAWQQALAAAVRAHARAVRRRAGRSATPCAAACATSCARPGSAACGFSIASSASDFDVVHRRPTLGARRRAVVGLALAAWTVSA